MKAGAALADPQLQAVRQQLEQRGLALQVEQARVFQLAGAQVSLILPLGEEAHLIWNHNGNTTSALGLIRQGQKTLNITATGEQRVVKPLKGKQIEKLLQKLREKPKFQAFEERLKGHGHKLDEVRLRAAIDETGNRLLMGLAVEGDEEEVLSYALVMEAEPKGGEDWEPVGDEEPQAGLCAQAQSAGISGAQEASTVTALTTGSSGSGYYSGGDTCALIEDPYLAAQCYKNITPQLEVSKTSLSYGQMVVNQSKDLGFTVYNSGGGTLTGTVSGSGICTIVSGGSFSLGAGWHQTVTVRCKPTAVGSFSLSLPVSSNGGNKTVVASGTAVLGPKLQVTPTSLDFGIVALGGTKDSTVTVKNVGDGTLTGSLTATTPYSIVSGGSFSLAPGASQVVRVRFSPTVAGSFPKSLSVSSNGGSASVSASGTGEAVNLEITPPNLDFPIAWTGSALAKKFTVKNLGLATVTVTVSVAGPFSVSPAASFTLVSQQSQEVTVTFRPEIAGSFAGDVSVASVGITVAGVGVQGIGISPEEYFALAAQILNTSNAILQAQGRSIVTLQPKDLNLTLVGLSSFSKETLLELYEMALAANGGLVISPGGIDLCFSVGFGPASLSICLSHIIDAYNSFQLGIAEGRIDLQKVAEAIEVLASDQFQYATQCKNNQSFREFLTILNAKIFHESPGFSDICDDQDLRAEFLSLLDDAKDALPGRLDLIQFLIEKTGPASLIIAREWKLLNDNDGLNRLRGRYGDRYKIGSFIELVESVKNLVDRAPDMASHVLALMATILEAGRNIFESGGEGPQAEMGVEGLARVFATVDTANTLLDHGWTLEALAYNTGPAPANIGRIDVWARKGDTTGFIMLEPYLGTGRDFTDLAVSIDQAVHWINLRGRAWSGTSNQVLVIRINGGDAQAIQNLCDLINDPDSLYSYISNATNVKIMVVVNGSVECTNQGINHDFTMNEAEQMCQDMGLCEPPPPQPAEGAPGPEIEMLTE